MNVRTGYTRGDVVGYQGHRAVVHGVDGDEVRVIYHEDVPRRHCDACNGEGSISLGTWRSSVRTQSCGVCRGTGEIPPRRLARDEWVSVDDLEEPPARDEHPMAAEAAALIANSRAVLDT